MITPLDLAALALAFAAGGFLVASLFILAALRGLQARREHLDELIRGGRR